ncbi:uncharacterized protein LOC126828886 [Patella vulgata]|uniref:uncharacterized protein LOC126828886 n=1 Tax=Patella vulgata TaxID=6465 RepID=UPI00218063E4|nr:uncharacterized protein LOC126828886 [Patella vulgata]
MAVTVGITVLTALICIARCQQDTASVPNFFPATDQAQVPPAQGPGGADVAPVQDPNQGQQPSLPPVSNQPQVPQVPAVDGQTPQTNQGPAVPFPGQVPPQIPGQIPQQPFQGAPFPGRIPQNFYPYQQQPGPMPSFQNTFAADPFQQNPFPFQQTPFPQGPNPLLQGQMQQDSSQFSKFLFCQVANGTMPDWTDITCNKYWSCLNFNLSLLTCPADQAYDYPSRACATTANVKCQEQNVNFWQLLQATIRGGAQPMPSFTPLSSLPGDRQSVSLETDVCTKLGANLPRLESVTNSALLNLSNCPFNNCNMTLITFVCP